MDQINEKKNSFMTNVGIIFISQILVKLLGMIYRMVITNIQGFGDAGNGFYSAGFQVYTLLLAISSVGIPNAISKLISERAALGDYAGAHRLFKTALTLFAAIGLFFSIALYAFSGYISHHILHMDGAVYTMRALSPSIFFVCTSSVIRGYFAGLNNMKATGNSQVLEQLFKSTLTVIFVVLAIGQSPEIMAAWANFATSVACILSFGYLIAFYYRRKGGIFEAIRAAGKPHKTETAGAIIKAVLMLAVPISICSVITSVNRIIDTATITRGIEIAFANYIPSYAPSVKAIVNPTAEQLNKEAVRLAGLLSKSDTLINLPLAMNIAFATVLVPAISHKTAIGDREGVSREISYSMLISILIILPCAAGYIALAQPIYDLIYPNARLGAGLLQLSSIALIFSAVTQTITGALQGFGRVYIPALGLLIGCICKIILNLVLISNPAINIYGATISSIVCQVISFAVCTFALSREITFKVSFSKYILKPVICCTVMGGAAYCTHRLVTIILGGGRLSNMLGTLGAIGIGAVVYFVCVLISGILTKDEYRQLPGGEKIVSALTRMKLIK